LATLAAPVANPGFALSPKVQKFHLVFQSCSKWPTSKVVPERAYAPAGSIKKGQALAVSGGEGKTLSCGPCHGSDPKGLGAIPGIAGRSPSYIVRQFYDFKYGTRAGIGSALMKASVEKLAVEDMLALAAYAASLAP
jgi:cytochrome c553